MVYTVLWIVAFMLNGTPVSFSAILPGQACTFEAASAVYADKRGEAGPNVFQDGFEWWCDAIADRPPERKA